MITKLLFKVGIKVGIVIGVLLGVPYFIMGKGELPDFLTGIFQKAEEKVNLPQNISSVTTDTEVTVYQWVDENGIKQFGNAPPPGAVNVKTINLKPNTNIMKAFKAPEEEEEPEEGPKVTTLLESSPYSVDGVKGVVDDAKGVQDTLDKRMEEQQKLLDSLTGSGKH